MRADDGWPVGPDEGRVGEVAKPPPDSRPSPFRARTTAGAAVRSSPLPLGEGRGCSRAIRTAPSSRTARWR